MRIRGKSSSVIPEFASRPCSFTMRGNSDRSIFISLMSYPRPLLPHLFSF